MSNRHPFFKQRLYTLWHRFTSRKFSTRTLFFQGAVLVSWFFAFIFPPLRAGKIGFAVGIMATVAYILYGAIKSFVDTNEPSRKDFEKYKIARKIMTSAVLDKMLQRDNGGAAFDRADGIAILEDILDIVANHVRSFRFDREGEKIFCSLLIERDSDHLEVIARNRSGRTSEPIKRKRDRLVWQAMASTRVIETGDVSKDFPATPLNTPYKSILCIPIVYNEHSIAGLSIDSSEPYHFTGQEERINTRLMPYLVLIKMNLLRYGLVKGGNL